MRTVGERKNGRKMYVRRFEEKDAQETAEMIRGTLMEINRKDYDEKEMERIADGYCAERIRRIAEEAHLYVVCSEGKIIGTGAVKRDGMQGEECEIVTVFAHPGYQGCGVGRKIICALEDDEWFRKAGRVHLDASITAHRFYEKMGYCYVNGEKELDEYGLYHMEKNAK